MANQFPPDLAARYTIERELASGGFATVFLARHKELDRTVAVKLLHDRIMERSTELERFVNEARVTAGLSHPNILKVLDFGAETGVPWIVYEYLPGSSLADLLDEGPFEPVVALEACTQVAAALGEAHTHGILHRDVKPGNVLVASPGNYKVGDFGLARHLEGGRSLTATGVVVGTPAFFAPELLYGDEPTIATDLYALGVMLYQLLVDDLPGLGPDAANTFRALWHERVAEAGVDAGLARRVERVAVQLLAVDPKARPPTAEDARALLEEAATGKSARSEKRSADTQVTPAATPRPRLQSRGSRRVSVPPTPLSGTRTRPPVVWPVVAAVALAAVVGGVAWLSRGQPSVPVGPPAGSPSAGSVASAPAVRSAAVDQAMVALQQDIDRVNERAHFVDRKSVLGDNLHVLQNPAVVEPLYLRSLTDSVRVVRALRDEHVFGPQALIALRTVATAVETSARLLSSAPHGGVQRWISQVSAEIALLEREAAGSTYVAAGSRWVQGRRSALLGRTGDRDALGHLMAAHALMDAAPDQAWKNSAEAAESALLLSQSVHQHAKRLRGFDLLHDNPGIDLRRTGLAVIEAVNRCVDTNAPLVKDSGHALCHASEVCGELLAHSNATPADRALVCRVARKLLAAVVLRTEDARLRACQDALVALACPKDNTGRPD